MKPRPDSFSAMARAFLATALLAPLSTNGPCADPRGPEGLRAGASDVFEGLKREAAPSGAPPQAGPKSGPFGIIYGDDDRLDLYDVKDPSLLRLADAAVALLSSKELTRSASGDSYQMATKIYGEEVRLCEGERFRDQPDAGFCSGALVAPDLVMTAGHCVATPADCADVRFVFGFSVSRAGEYPSAVAAKDVYGCKEIVGREHNDAGADWGLLRLDRPAADHAPIPVDRSGSVAKGDPLVAIGHPMGLPTKVAGGASVWDASPEGYFVSDLDVFPGNSGSVVLNSRTGLAVGILARGQGDPDFTFDAVNQCNVSYRCPPGECRGEDSTKVGVFAALIPAGHAAKLQARPGPYLESLAPPGRPADGAGRGLAYHGGPVMTGPKRLYYIWYGDWSDSPAPAVLSDFAAGLGGSAYFNINAGYFDAQGRHVENAASLAGSVSDRYSKGRNISNRDVPSIVEHALAGGLPADPDGIYAVLISSDVDDGSSCNVCGWHGRRAMRGADIKYAFVASMARCPVCSPQTVGPNGDAGADAMANVLAHEISEAVTDPGGDAWYSDQGAGENADICAWEFGPRRTLPGGALYNVTLGARKFYLQQLWVNDRGGYCGLSY